MHAGVPQERHVQNVHRVHRVRSFSVLHPTAVAVRLPLPEDIPQVKQNPTADRAFRLTSVHRRPHYVAEQPVTTRKRFHTAGTYTHSCHIGKQGTIHNIPTYRSSWYMVILIYRNWLG